jgi:hypothetical protein
MHHQKYVSMENINYTDMVLNRGLHINEWPYVYLMGVLLKQQKNILVRK